MLGPGDLIFHPSHGFGTIRGMTRRDPLHPIQDGASAGGFDQTQAYYDIQLMDGGTLLVPVSRGERVGLRLLFNGVDAITLCLNSPAESLPADARKRAAELWARGQIGESTALVTSVRDMLAQSHGRTLTASEKAWLDKSCERLSSEAALGRSYFPIAGARCHLGSGEPTERPMTPGTICGTRSLDLHEHLRGDSLDAHR